MAQSLRRSQYITTYGPGAILEGSGGPRIILDIEHAELFSASRPAGQYEITDDRLSQALLSGARILRLPSNAELNIPDSRDVYKTDAFPRWALCVTHDILYYKTAHDTRACPQCAPLPDSFAAWDRAHRQAIRFVRACPEGHLDDVDWRGIIAHNRPSCSPTYLIWHGGGGSLSQVDIICPVCRASINLGQAYGREWPCSGRFPEQGRDRPGNCTAGSRIIQRGAANLRMAELQTALTIPPRSTSLHRLLESLTIQAVLVTAQPRTKQELLQAIQPLVQRRTIHPSVITTINSYTDAQIRTAIHDILHVALPTDARTLRLEEFNALQNAATHGHPPVPSSRPGDPDQFEVIRRDVHTIIAPSGHDLRITPVNRLRVVMVQTGYRRLEPLNQPVTIPYFDGVHIWYPGVELFGEGVFIDLTPPGSHNTATAHFPLTGQPATTWLQAWHDPSQFDPLYRPENRDQYHPVFVWWHTLAHRLINALSVDSGYSSAAVRERIYVDIDENNGQARGGILLYTVQPGGDGTLGGMVALVPHFNYILDSALRNIDACSNDPLCSEETFGRDKYNGAACYACALVSETSCEYRNMRLDRNLLLDNLP